MMAKQQTQQLVTRSSRIGDIPMINSSKASLVNQILNEFGIHCTSCGAASFETLEMGVLGHGFSEKDLDKLIIDLNKAISENAEIKVIQENDFKLTLSSAGIKKVKEAISSQGKKSNMILKVSVIAGGCSGFLYDMQFIEKPSKEDLNFKQDNVNIAVDRKSMDLLNGIEIDYIDTLNESGFKFKNPNSSGDCGCGKSFH